MGSLYNVLYREVGLYDWLIKRCPRRSELLRDLSRFLLIRAFRRINLTFVLANELFQDLISTCRICCFNEGQCGTFQSSSSHKSFVEDRSDVRGGQIVFFNYPSFSFACTYPLQSLDECSGSLSCCNIHLWPIKRAPEDTACCFNIFLYPSLFSFSWILICLQPRHKRDILTKIPSLIEVRFSDNCLSSSTFINRTTELQTNITFQTNSIAAYAMTKQTRNGERQLNPIK